MNEQNAIATLMRDRYRRSTCIPRFTPIHWWECDVFQVSPAGYFREFEIKLTRSDFFADAKKESRRYVQKADGSMDWRQPPYSVNKHKLLSSGDPKGPVQFWYVTPRGLIQLTELPIFAGLIELEDRGEDRHPLSRWSEITMVEAPRLHRRKVDPKLTEQARDCCYYRMHDLLKDRQ